jgi:hypothetical protein
MPVIYNPPQQWHSDAEHGLRNWFKAKMAEYEDHVENLRNENVWLRGEIRELRDQLWAYRQRELSGLVKKGSDGNA